MTPREQEVFAIIREAAELGAPFPENQEIARRRGFSSAGSTGAIITALVDGGHMTVTRTKQHRQAHIGPHSTADYSPPLYPSGAVRKRPSQAKKMQPLRKFGPDTCRYLFGEPKNHDWCGRDVLKGKPYCEPHYLLCHEIRPRKGGNFSFGLLPGGQT